MSRVRGHVLGPKKKRAGKQGVFYRIDGGGRGIRTPERVTPLTVFKTAGFNHSPIPPIPIVSNFIRCISAARATSLPASLHASLNPALRSGKRSPIIWLKKP